MVGCISQSPLQAPHTRIPPTAGTLAVQSLPRNCPELKRTASPTASYPPSQDPTQNRSEGLLKPEFCRR